MSLIPFWVRHLRNVASRDPFIRAFEDPHTFLALDSFFRDPSRYIQADHADSEYVKSDGHKVEVHWDVQNFTPDQISVKSTGFAITVEGKKEIKTEHGWTKSHFERRFILPDGFPPERVECHLDKGKLLLVAFRAEPLSERTIPIKEATESGTKPINEDKPKVIL